MPAQLDAQIADRVHEYLNGHLSFHEFQQWFVPASWNIERSGNRSAIALAHNVDGILAESSSANWDEMVLQRELANAILPSVSRNRIQHPRVIRNYLTSNVVDEYSRRPPINLYWAELSVALGR